MRWPISKAWLEAHSPGGKRLRKGKPKRETGMRPEHRRVFMMAYALCAILLVVDVYAIFLSYARNRDAEAPSDILGLWTTTDPRYEDRALEITDTTLVFYTGEGHSITYRISDVSVEESEYFYYYTILYGAGDDESTLAFDYTSIPADRIRLRNQRDMAWTKVTDDSVAAPDSLGTGVP